MESKWFCIPAKLQYAIAAFAYDSIHRLSKQDCNSSHFMLKADTELRLQNGKWK